MIHFVGRLNPTSTKIEMYDMLGNVWELVRDDWSAPISESIGGSDDNPSVNPIVGDTATASANKVIKGGAFNEFCRKEISSSREQIE